jgi:signal peptidase II
LAGSAALLTIIVDQITKSIIIEEIGPDAARRVIEILPGLRFIFVRNTGSAFGLFQGQGSILTVLVLVALGFLAVFFYRNARRDPLVALALGLQVGGAIGNLIDRIRYGYVVDFIDVDIIDFPTFNVADSAITVGTVLLVYALLFRDGRPAEPQPDTEVEPCEPAIPQRET